MVRIQGVQWKHVGAGLVVRPGQLLSFFLWHDQISINETVYVAIENNDHSR